MKTILVAPDADCAAAYACDQNWRKGGWVFVAYGRSLRRIAKTGDVVKHLGRIVDCTEIFERKQKKKPKKRKRK